MRRGRTRFSCYKTYLVGLCLCLAVSTPVRAAELTLEPFKASGIYELGERVGWVATARHGGANHVGKYKFTVKANNWKVIKSGQIDLSTGTATIELTWDEPAMLFMEIEPVGDGAPRRGLQVAGAAIAPTRLQPCVACPADFDAFWEAKIKRLKEVPEEAVLTPGETDNATVQYATIRMNHVDGKHVHGQLAKPKREGKFPALLILQWASPPYPLQKPWVTNYAARGWLTLNIEPHDVLPDQPQAYYDALPPALKNYQSIGQDDRDKCYFLQMYLADYRAVDYLVGRSDWDGKTLVVMGTSMGGQQSLCVAGLHPRVTHVIVNEPAGCDTNGPLHGRQSGYPNFPSDNPKVRQTALYFDVVNFAARIKARSLVSMGFVDTVTPPAGIWSAFNQIAGPKLAVPMPDSPHNHLATPAQQRPYTDRSAEWLEILVQGGEVLAGESAAPAAPASPAVAAHQPSPRTDANSRIAHAQLLDKARQGRIDVYFVGDSITRRWGCTDPQYRELLANWNKNFFGWNAANFAWGGDTTHNVLWRLENGELDGVNPRVIVVQAGTNNLGRGPAADEIADVTTGLKAIVDICRRKAPRATIVLTAIFPRNDNMALIPTINEINEQIAKFADGKRVRFLNVNDRLADTDGKLLDGMMMDRLHPTATGYQVWADGLKPILRELLGPPGDTDHAPPPTGDPSARPAAAVPATP